MPEATEALNLDAPIHVEDATGSQTHKVAASANTRFEAPDAPLVPQHSRDTPRALAVQHSARVCGRCARRFRLGPPPACAGALAPRRLRVPDLTPS